jgi:glycosyltransferase involved in cell wall biosynthesis
VRPIIYIGNHLKGTNPTTLDLLVSKFKKEGYKVTVYSSFKSMFWRWLHMCWGVLTAPQKALVIIDTFSTLNFYYACSVAVLCKLRGLPYLPILHGGDLPKRLKRSPKLSHFLFDGALVNVAPSNYLFEAFHSQFKTVVIPNLLDLKQYKFHSRSFESPRLLFVRAFQDIYNPLMAVKVLHQLSNKYPQAKLGMVGPFKDDSIHEVKRYIKSNQLEYAIEITGKLSKADWIEKSRDYNVFINTSKVDNTPVSVLEAMALGLGVVSTNVGGVPYIIENEKNGFLVESDDEVAMVKAIANLIENTDVAYLIRKNARQKVEQFDWEVLKNKWFKVFDDVEQINI